VEFDFRIGERGKGGKEAIRKGKRGEGKGGRPVIVFKHIFDAAYCRKGVIRGKKKKRETGPIGFPPLRSLLCSTRARTKDVVPPKKRKKNRQRWGKGRKKKKKRKGKFQYRGSQLTAPDGALPLQTLRL